MSGSDKRNEEIVNKLIDDFQKSLGSESVQEAARVEAVDSDKDSDGDLYHDTTDDFTDPGFKNKSESKTEPNDQTTTDDAQQAVDATTSYDPYFDVENDEESMRSLEANLTEDEKQSRKEQSLVYKNEGNELYRAENYRDSINSYTKGLNVCPLGFSSERSILYANRSAAYGRLNLLDEAILDAGKAIELNPKYVKALIRRAEFHEKTEKLDDSLADYKKVLEVEPSHREALSASMRLQHEINERNEKLKTEMLSKLKDLGNMILNPFGLSTENFKMTQDPNSGGYSVQFQQKK